MLLFEKSLRKYDYTNKDALIIATSQLVSAYGSAYMWHKNNNDDIGGNIEVFLDESFSAGLVAGFWVPYLIINHLKEPESKSLKESSVNIRFEPQNLLGLLVYQKECDAYYVNLLHLEF